MKKIKLVNGRRTPLARSLWYAMHNTTEDVLQKFKLEVDGKISDEVEVKVLVNGVEVDLVEELADFVKHIDDTLEDAVKEEAIRRITKDNKLEELSYSIRDAEWKIRDKLEALMQED